MLQNLHFSLPENMPIENDRKKYFHVLKINRLVCQKLQTTLQVQVSLEQRNTQEKLPPNYFVHKFVGSDKKAMQPSNLPPFRDHSGFFETLRRKGRFTRAFTWAMRAAMSNTSLSIPPKISGSTQCLFAIYRCTMGETVSYSDKKKFQVCLRFGFLIIVAFPSLLQSANLLNCTLA